MTDIAQNKAQIRKILTEMGPAAVQTLLVEEHQSMLHEKELAKQHPLVGFALSPADFEALCLHLIDGGGVTEDMAPTLNNKSLTLIVWQAVHDRDQVTFWRELPHLVKSWVAARGLIRQVPGTPGATIASGLGSMMAPIVAPLMARVESMQGDGNDVAV